MIYAIGDIHGHLEKLLIAHNLIAADKAEHGAEDATVVHVGDLVDRGPDSKGVITFLLDGIRRKEEWVVLKGNHDDMFARALNGGDGTDPHLGAGMTWQDAQLGGKETLKSYGVEKRRLERQRVVLGRLRKAVPAAHRDFIESLPLSYREEDMIFVHAGIRPGFELDAQDEDDLLWIRDAFLWHTHPHEALIVHGHTPVDEPTHYGNRVNLDTGAGWGNPLVPVVFDEGECFTLTEQGRKPILRL